MSAKSGYIVKRSIEDGGPLGDTMAYVRVDTPNPGETIYHGNFRKSTMESGQFDADSTEVYYPVGPITEETYTGNTETF